MVQNQSRAKSEPSWTASCSTDFALARLDFGLGGARRGLAFGSAGLAPPADVQAGVALAVDPGGHRDVAPGLPFHLDRRAALAAADDLEIDVVGEVFAAGDGHRG